MFNFGFKNVTIIRMVGNVTKCVATAIIKNNATTWMEPALTDVTIAHLEGCVIKVKNEYM